MKASNEATIITSVSLSEQCAGNLLTEFHEQVSSLSSSSTAKTDQFDVDGQNSGPKLDFRITLFCICLRQIYCDSFLANSPFFKALAQKHCSSETDVPYFIRSIPHQNLPLPSSQHHGAEKH
jgi:hypothetical protein